MGNISSGAARAVAWTIAAVATGVAVYVGCKALDGDGPPSKPPHTTPSRRIVPEKELVDDLRVLWSYERNFAYHHHHKRLSNSIEELRPGFEMGADGYVLKQSIWDARWEAGDGGTPASYKVDLPGQGKKKVGAYRFRVIPVTDEEGKDAPLTRVLVALPKVPADDDVCFVALCGPVDLRNDFTFSMAWPVYELKATKAVVEALRGMESVQVDILKSRLTDGDLAPFVKASFKGLEWPEPTTGTPAQ